MSCPNCRRFYIRVAAVIAAIGIAIFCAMPLHAQANKHVIVDNCLAGCGSAASSAQTDAYANGSVPQSGAFISFFNGTSWDRARGDITNGLWVNCKTGCSSAAAVLMADATSNPTIPQTAAFPLVWNGTTWDRLKGDATNGAYVNIKASVALGRSWTLSSGTDSVSASVSNFPSTYPPVAAAALADTTTNPTTPSTGAYISVFNGTTWDRLRGDVTNGAWVNVKSSIGIDVTDRAGRLLGHVVIDAGAAAIGSVSVSNFPSTYDTSDRAARLLGVVYGSQGQQIKQTATNFNLQSELAVGGTLIDPRAIRALTVADIVGLGAGTAKIGITTTDQSTHGTTDLVAADQTKINGVPVSTGNGIADTGTQRISLAQELTYSAALTAKTATAAGTGVFFSLCGSATKTVTVQRFNVSGTVATAAVWGDIILKRTSTATSGGTATTLTVLPYDSTNAAGTAVAKFYTVLATAGTSAGGIDSETQLFPVTAISATLQPVPAPIAWRWRDTDSQAPVLRGVAQCMEVNFGTTTTNAPTLTLGVAWTEK